VANVVRVPVLYFALEQALHKTRKTHTPRPGDHFGPVRNLGFQYERDSRFHLHIL